jgi:hypothetical protein
MIEIRVGLQKRMRKGRLDGAKNEEIVLSSLQEIRRNEQITLSFFI